MPAAPETIVSPTAQELAEDVAGRVVATLNAALAVRPLAHLVLTGGSILESVLRSLRASAATVDWTRVAVWWGDERFVPADSDDRNDRAAFAALLGDLALKAANVHRMPAADGAAGPDAGPAARAYARELAAAADAGQDVPRFDVVLLGIGPDGHCASLFPNHPGVDETDRSVLDVHNSPKPPPRRISLSFRALDAAEEVWFIAAGSGKADAVALAHSGASRVAVPSAGQRGRRRTLWLIDRDAAARLPTA